MGRDMHLAVEACECDVYPGSGLAVALHLILLTPALRQTYDIILRSESNDVLGTLGFLTALKHVCRTRCGGLIFAGLPCNTCLGLRTLTF